MSDISDNGAFAANLANNNSQNFGPTAVAGQANTNAQTGLLQQQAQGAQIQNASARLQYQLFRQGMQHLTDFSGQNGPTLGASANDSSGVTASSASPAANVPPAISSGVTPEDDIGRSAADQAKLEAVLEQKYNIDPAGTAAEQQAIIQAHQYAVQMKLSGNKGLADAADERVAMLITQRDMGVTSRKNAAALDASEHYDKLSAVEAAPDGKAFEIMQNVMPESALRLKKASSDSTPEELDEAARDTAGHMAAFMHRFTDRPVKVGDDGATYDEKSGLRVDVPVRGVSAERQASLLSDANKIVETKNSDGTVTTEPQFKKDGYQNPQSWVTDAVAQIRSRNSSNNITEAVHNHAAQFGHVTPGAPPVPGGTLYRGPQPNAPQPGAPQPGAPQPGAPQPGAPQPGAQPGAPGQQPPPQRSPQQQQPPGDPVVLKAALADGDYKLKTPPVVAGRSQSPADLEQAKATVGARTDLLKDSQDATGTASQALQYLTAAKAIIDTKGTALGAYGGVINQLSRVFGPITGGADATNYAEIAKYLSNAALQTAKQNYGARMTQSEVKLALEEQNPSTKMTPDAISDLVKTNIAAARYSIDSARRAKLFLQSGGDPQQFNEWNQQYFPREKLVNEQPTRPGQDRSGGQPSTTAAPVKVQSRADAMKLAPGTVFVTPDGRQLVR